MDYTLQAKGGLIDFLIVVHPLDSPLAMQNLTSG
jgi:hypothetical protein